MSKVKSEPLNKFSGFNFLYKKMEITGDYTYTEIVREFIERI